MNNKRQQKVTKDALEVTTSNIVGVRLGDELLGKLDAEVDRRRMTTPWAEITRAEIIREAVYRLLHTATSTNTQTLERNATNLNHPSKGGCVICGEALPPRNKTLCDKPECKKELHRRREQDRRQAAKE